MTKHPQSANDEGRSCKAEIDWVFLNINVLGLVSLGRISTSYDAIQLLGCPYKTKL